MANFTGSELEPAPIFGDFNSPPAVNQQGTAELSDPVTPPARIPVGLEVALQPNVLAYVNRVYDSIAADVVTWTTFGFSDLVNGEKYPGPGQFDPTASGSNTSDHTTEAIIDASLI